MSDKNQSDNDDGIEENQNQVVFMNQMEYTKVNFG